MMANLVTSSEEKGVNATKIAKVIEEVSWKELGNFVIRTPIHIYSPYYNSISFINTENERSKVKDTFEFHDANFL